MASPAEELQAAMLARLRESEALSVGVGGRISDQQPEEFPCAWVGVTQTSTDGDADTVNLLATVHIWERSGEAVAKRLAQEAQAAFQEPPSVDSLSIVSWAPDYNEVRLINEHSAYRGLVRFRAQVKRP